jgi:hypothetical protein
MMFNRKERAELLEGMVISDEDAAAPSFRQVRMQRRLSIHCKIQSVSA